MFDKGLTSKIYKELNPIAKIKKKKTRLKSDRMTWQSGFTSTSASSI
jgi:hypothetical protein